MDALSSLLYEVRGRGALFTRSVMRPPWSLRFEDPARLTLVTMLRGQGSVLVDGAPPSSIGTGSVAIVAGTEPFGIASEPDVAPEFVVRGSTIRPVGQDDSAGEHLSLSTWTNGESLTNAAVLLTGAYRVQSVTRNRVVNVLPRVLVVPAEEDMCALIDLIELEITRDEPGQQVVIDRVLDLLLVATLREWFALPDSKTPPWYEAMSDPLVDRVLQLMHDNPADPWTVESLARRAGVSRATLARRFTDLVGCPPRTYLTEWRVSLAADLLRQPESTVASVARRVGYANAFGLSAAFKRVRGTRPRDHRDQVASGASGSPPR